MSNSFLRASVIRSLEISQKIKDPSIAIWNNGGSKVAFVGNDNEAKTYIYKNECFRKENNYNSSIEIIYDAGPHDICDILKNGEAIYIEKIKGKWCKLGYIMYCSKINNTNNSNNYKFIIYINYEELATNKRDALTTLGYEKQKGKGTGTLMWGFCKIKKI